MNDARLDKSFTVGARKLGEVYGKSRSWGLLKLKEWFDEQERGGPRRVFQKGKCLYTTVSVLRQEMPGYQDVRFEKRIDELDKLMNTMLRRVENLTYEINLLKHQLANGVRK